MKWEILNLFRNNKKYNAVNTNHTYKQVIFSIGKEKVWLYNSSFMLKKRLSGKR